MYVSVNKDGSYNVSNCYPTRIGYVEFRNDRFHHADKDRLDPFKPKDAILKEMVYPNDVKQGYVEIWDFGEDNVLGTIEVSKEVYSRWSLKPSKLKPETIKALGLENLTWEDEPVEI